MKKKERTRNIKRSHSGFYRKKILGLCLAGCVCMGCFSGCENPSAFYDALPDAVDFSKVPESADDSGAQGIGADESARLPEETFTGLGGADLPSREDARSAEDASGLFDSSRFSGHITSIEYAGPGKLFVRADSLFLYDGAQDRIVGEYKFPEEDVSLYGFYAISGGYALFGELPEKPADGGAPEGGDGSSEYVEMSMSSEMTVVTGNEEGMRCWIFDGQLALQKSLDLHRLMKEQGFDEPRENAAAISKDGTQIAVAGIRNLHVYHVEDGTFSVLTDERTQSGDLRYVMPIDVRFTGRKSGSATEAEGMIFTGIAIPEGQSDSVPIYGTMDSDGSGLHCRAVSDYALSDAMIAYEDEIWFPEDFLHATGKLLVTNPAGQVIRTVNLEGEDTGADGLFGSDTGEYIATAAILGDVHSWNGGWRVRIYDAETGKALWEQNVGTDLSSYTGLSCSVKILDSLRECIVTCGRGQDTVTTAYFF